MLTKELSATYYRFVEWSKRYGPFPTIVDGANVGMFNQNFEDARFNFPQVERLMALLREERGPDRKAALLFLHQRRVKGGPANAGRAAGLIKQWRESGACVCMSCERTSLRR
jgi:proteinaceous RNase P